MRHVKSEVYPHPLQSDADLRIYTRQFTGATRVTRAYLLDRKHGKIVWACAHQHRNMPNAERCAERKRSQMKQNNRQNDAESGKP